MSALRWADFFCQAVDNWRALDNSLELCQHGGIVITVNNLSLAFGKRFLFKDVNIQFNPGNCYGLIGANGAGKSTFLKILAGEIEPSSGGVSIPKGLRMAVLQQNQFAFDEYTVMDTVIMGHKRLYQIMKEKEALYAKEHLTDEEGLRISELEGEFAELNGWEAESEASILLDGLGIDETYHQRLMRELEGGEKVRVLLAQALFGNPDILLLDEPTNNLDMESIAWLEDFLFDFKNTVIVVSHDRHFLNQVCTHIADIDYGTIQLYVGNYDFWYESSQLLARQKRDEKRRAEEKAAELKSFIMRFAHNAAKSRQATSRQKMLEKLDLESLKPSNRKYPYIAFKPERPCGKSVLRVTGLNKSIEGVVPLKDFELTVEQGDKIALLGDAGLKTLVLQLLAGEIKFDSGSIEWGQTIKVGYFPKDNTHLFKGSENLVDWLRPYSKEDDDTFIRGFLGRMLFSGDETLKPVNVLSGGERVRCLLAKLMLQGPNVLLMDEPTNHLDLEAITSLNKALEEYDQVLIFTSHDHQLVASTANRIIELTPFGFLDRKTDFETYLRSPEIKLLRDKIYHGHKRLEL